MTKEQFFRNCLTEEGRKENQDTFRPLTMETYYKNTEFDINDYSQWDKIVYMSKYGNQITWEAFIDGKEVEKPVYDENDPTKQVGTIKEIEPDESFGEILPQENWEIYNMWDILQDIIKAYKAQHKTIDEYIEMAKQLFENLKGESIQAKSIDLYGFPKIE